MFSSALKVFNIEGREKNCSTPPPRVRYLSNVKVFVKQFSTPPFLYLMSKSIALQGTYSGLLCENNLPYVQLLAVATGLEVGIHASFHDELYGNNWNSGWIELAINHVSCHTY